MAGSEHELRRALLLDREVEQADRPRGVAVEYVHKVVLDKVN